MGPVEEAIDTDRDARLSEDAAPEGGSPAAAPDISAIAVLPFADMSPSRDQDYLCDGLAEELINALTQIDGLRVAARTRVLPVPRKGEDVRAVGEQLGVGTLLEGSVRKAGDRLRVTVQLIEVATGYHRWSRRFDRTARRRVRDPGRHRGERGEVAARRRLQPAREGTPWLRPQTGTAAYEYYLRGRQLLPRLTQPDLEASRRDVRRAIELDPGYGPAWAGLATAHATLYEWFGASDADLARAERTSRTRAGTGAGSRRGSRRAGLRAVAVRRYDDAAREFEESIRLNPNLFDAVLLLRADQLRPR